MKLILIIIYSLLTIACSSKQKTFDCSGADIAATIVYEGHRGSTKIFPNDIQNSIPALLHTLENSNTGRIEFDIRPTLDNEIVLAHDDILCRVTDTEMLVSETNYADLPVLKDGSRIPTIYEYIDILSRYGFSGEVNIDIKVMNKKTWAKLLHIITANQNLKLNVIMDYRAVDLNNLNQYCSILAQLDVDVMEYYGRAQLCGE